MSDEQFKMIMQGLREVHNDVQAMKKNLEKVNNEVQEIKIELKEFKEQNSNEHKELLAKYEVLEKHTLDKLAKFDLEITKIKLAVAQ